MEDVEHKQNAREPEARHRDYIEKCSTCQIRVFRYFNADEAEQV